VRLSLIVLLAAAMPAAAFDADADAAAALALAKAARERPTEPLRRVGSGWIPGTNPPQWSDSWMPPPAGEGAGWVKPLVEPFSDWNVNHWDLPDAPKKTATAVARVGYPVRQNWWFHPAEIHAHLKSGEHKGKWPAEWVDGLTGPEAESLHSDDHEGRVRWEYVPKAKVPQPAEATTPAPPLTTYAPTYTLPSFNVGGCPNGKCPGSPAPTRRGFFR
jgi:hypothetical protein